MRVEDFDYKLPECLIAQSPLEQRDDSRLLVVNPQFFGPTAAQVDSLWIHSRFHDLPRFLQSGDVLVVNNSRVIPARLYGRKADTGAQVELLLTQPLSQREWLALAKPAKRLKKGAVVEFFDKETSEKGAADNGSVEFKPAGIAEVTEVGDEGLRRIRFQVDGNMDEFLNKAGNVPLPPYIHQPLENPNRYQTVYASLPGSVAAPTAGLHFTQSLLEEISSKGVEICSVTLHVGIGTFRPVSVDNVEDHVMHREWYEVPESTAQTVNRAHREGRRVIAVGTTALRTLESASESGSVVAGKNETGIFIYPGYKFRAVDALITNFHLPKSTLLMLVSAFMGRDLTLRSYTVAVAEEYRFFSFGDAMFITQRAV